jgi:hypothetical protein
MRIGKRLTLAAALEALQFAAGFSPQRGEYRH